MTGLPLVKLEQKFGASWVDVTGRLLWSESGAPVVITRGISEDGTPMQGTMTCTLDNSDGNLTPERAAGTWYPNVVRFREIRFSEFLNGAWRYRFWGYVDSEPLAWGNSVGTDCRVNLTAIDAIAMLSRKPLRSVAVEATAARSGLIGYWPLTEGDTVAATDQSGKGQPSLTVTQYGTGGEIAWSSGVILPTDSTGGIVFTPAGDNGQYLLSSNVIDLTSTWYVTVLVTPGAKDGYVFQIGTSSYSIGVWYDTSTDKLSAIETKVDSDGDPIDYVLSTTTNTWSGGAMEILTVTPTTVKLASSGTTGTRHSSATMLDSLVAVGGGFSVESGRERMYSGEVKHFALWSSSSAWGSTLTSDQTGGPAALTLLSTAVVKLAAWSGLTLTATVIGDDRVLSMPRIEGMTAADLFTQFMQGTLSRIAAGRDGSIRIAGFDYLPTAVTAPSGVIDSTVEWAGDPEGNVSEATVSWADGTQYVAKSSNAGQARDIPGVVPGSGGRSVADWVVATSAAPPRVPVAPFDLLTITTANAHALAMLDFGDLLSVPGLPVQLPSTTQGGIVDAFIETIGADIWTASIPTSNDSRGRMMIVGDAVEGRVTAGYLAAPLGPVVDDTNSDWHAGDEVTHTNLNAAAWTSTQMQVGIATVTPIANTVTTLFVTFPTPFTGTTPVVVLTPIDSRPGTEIDGYSVSGITTAGFNIHLLRTNTLTTYISWAAVN